MVLTLTVSAFHGAVTVRADFGDFVSDNDYDGYDSDDYSYDNDGGGLGGGFLTYLLFIFFGGIALLTTGGGSRSGHRKRTAGEQFTPQNLLKPVKDYVSLDPSFDEAAFCAYLKDLYERMQVSWHFRDLSDLKEALTTDFYNRSDRQLADKRVSGEIPVTEEVDVRQVSVLGYYQVGQDDHMVVMIRAALIAYYVNEQTGKLLRGDRKNKKLMTYEWDLVRKTEAHSEGWRLDNIKGISQQTLKES